MVYSFVRLSVCVLCSLILGPMFEGDVKSEWSGTSLTEWNTRQRMTRGEERETITFRHECIPGRKIHESIQCMIWKNESKKRMRGGLWQELWEELWEVEQQPFGETGKESESVARPEIWETMNDYGSASRVPLFVSFLHEEYCTSLPSSSLFWKKYLMERMTPLLSG